MVTSFDSVDWIIGLTLIGGTSALLLVAGLLVGRPVSGLLLAASVFILGVAAAMGVDLLMQIATSESFWKTGTHKRSAMRAFAPFCLGLLCSLGVILLVQRSLRKLQ